MLLIIIAGFCLGIIVIAGAMSGSRSSDGGAKGKVYVCTVDGAIGLKSVKITNQNEGTSITRITADLPYSFNYTSGDTLMFNVTILSGYEWNSWVFDDGTFDHHNPLTLKGTRTFRMTAAFLVSGT